MGELYRGVYSISPESKMLVYLVDQVKRMYAPIVLICGKQRIGKSSFGLSLADILSWFFHDEQFDVKEFVYFNAKKFLVKGISVRRRVVIIDEASKDLSKTEWYTVLNQVVTKIIETQGDLNNIYVIILPHASRLAKQHKIYIDLKLVMIGRGKARVFFMKKNYGELSDEIKKVTKAIFLNVETLPKPPDKLWEEYEGLATKRKREIAKEEIASIREKKRDWVCYCGQLNNFDNITCSNCGVKKGR